MFEPTIKQLDALARMESYIDVNSHRSHFSDKQEFEDYWNRVSERCDAKTRARKAAEHRAAGKPAPDPGKQRQRQQQRKLDYYNNKDRLLTYAEKYNKRYRPSQEKLRQQLILKCNNHELAATVVELFADKIDDFSLACMHARQMQQRGKNVRYIKDNLRKRYFDQHCIDTCLQDLQDDQGSILDQEALIKKVKQLQRKGLSQRAIRQQLCEQHADREPVDAAIESVYASDSDLNNLQRQLDKLLQKNIEQQKIIQRLMARGFSYSDIQYALASSPSG